MDAADSIRAVSSTFIGLVHPEDKVLISLKIKLSYIKLFSSAGPHRQAPLGTFPWPAFQVLSPMGFRRVASILWPSFWFLHVVLVWLCASLYPCDQQ